MTNLAENGHTCQMNITLNPLDYARVEEAHVDKYESFSVGAILDVLSSDIDKKPKAHSDVNDLFSAT